MGQRWAAPLTRTMRRGAAEGAPAGAPFDLRLLLSRSWLVRGSGVGGIMQWGQWHHAVGGVWIQSGVLRLGMLMSWLIPALV